MPTLSALELRGLLGDTMPFAGTSDEDPAINCIRLECDGTSLMALATDRYKVAKCVWTPDEETYDEDAEALIALFKVEEDERFAVRIALEDAKHIRDAFALKGPKRQFAPVTVSVRPSSIPMNTYTVSFVRQASSMWAPLSLHVEARGASRPHSEDVPEVDLHAIIRAAQNIEAYVPALNFYAKNLAAFAKARDHGPIEMEFTGEEQVVRWKMGHRFSGVIMPAVRNDKKADREDVPFVFAAEVD